MACTWRLWEQTGHIATRPPFPLIDRSDHNGYISRYGWKQAWWWPDDATGR